MAKKPRKSNGSRRRRPAADVAGPVIDRLEAIFRAVAAARPGPHTRELLTRVVDLRKTLALMAFHLEDLMLDELDLSGMANALGVSPSTVSRKFRGQSVDFAGGRAWFLAAGHTP